MSLVSNMFAGTGAPRKATPVKQWLDYTPSTRAARASSINPAGGVSIKTTQDDINAGFGTGDAPDPSTGPPWDFSSINDGKPSPELGRDEFLKIFLAQLQNQDPLNPMDGKDFVAQLATFSQLEQMMNANDTLTTIANYQSSINAAQSMNLLGKDIKAPGSQVTVRNGKSTPTSYVLPDDGDVVVKIYDKNGGVLREIDAGYNEAGQHDFVWDGKDDNGDTVPDGSYKIAVIGYNENDLPMSDVTTISQGPVTGVTFDDNGVPELLIGTYDPSEVDSEGNPIDNRISVYLSDVIEVSKTDQTTGGDDSVPNDELVNSAAAAAAGFKFGRPKAQPAMGLANQANRLLRRLTF